MRNPVFPLSVLLLALLPGCQSAPDTAPAGPAAPGTGHQPRPAAPAPRVQLQAVTKHVFSSRQQPDSFVLRILGDSLLTATAHFYITSAAGDTLWHDTFPVDALYGYGLLQYGDNPTPAQRAAYLRERVRTFFAPTAFSRPAVRPGQVPDRHAEKGVWAQVQQTGLPGFGYSLYEEDGRRLAYLPARRRAVVYYTCC